MKKLCAACKVIYQNANGDASRQQQQPNSAISQGAKAIVLDPVDSDGGGISRQDGAEPGVSRLLPMTVRSHRPQPTITFPSTTRKSAR